MLYTSLFPLLQTPPRLPVAFIIKSQHCSLRSFMVGLLISSPATTCSSLPPAPSLCTPYMLNWTSVLYLNRRFRCLTHALLSAPNTLRPLSHVFIWLSFRVSLDSTFSHLQGWIRCLSFKSSRTYTHSPAQCIGPESPFPCPNFPQHWTS